jgi:hypothetical protein
MPAARGNLSGWFTDHFSHLNQARYFTKVGLEKWIRAPQQILHAVTPEERQALPEDVRRVGEGAETYAVEGWPQDKPLVTSWSQTPHFYPPGDIVVVAPIAALYHFTSLSLTWASRLCVLWFLLLGHVGLWVMWRWAVWPAGALGALGFLWAYLEVVHWSLEGFFDVVLLIPLVLAAVFLHRRRHLAAILAFCCAAFVHFKAFFFAPIALFAVYSVIRHREYRAWTRRDLWSLAAIGLLSLATLWTFYELYPWMNAMDDRNVLYWGSGAFRHRPFWAVAVLTFVAFAVARSRLDWVLVVWVTLMLVRMPSVYQWYTVSIVPWLGFPLASQGWRTHVARGARLAFVLAVAVFSFTATLRPDWLREVASRAFGG